jgi:phosphatidylinositol alpha-1,6-mannosyltransferase
MLRPLYIHTHEFFPKYGGISTYCHEFATAAAQRGHDTTVYGPRGSAAPEFTEDAPAYRLQQERYHSGHDPLNIWRSRAALARRFEAAPKALHVLAEPGPILALGLTSERRPPPPVTLILHGSEICRWASRLNPVRCIARRAFSKAEKICTVSKAVNKALITAFPEVSGKVSTIHPALPAIFRHHATSHHGERFCDSQSTPFADASAEGILELLSVGRLHPRKGFQDVLAAVAALPAKNRAAIRYTIAGARSDDAYLARLKKLAKRVEVDVHWQLDPESTALEALYQKAHIFALTSLPHRHSIEGFGLVYAEAGAFGLPCLAYSTGGAGEAVLDGKTGYVLAPKDVAGLADRLKFLCERPDHRLIMGAAGREHALSRSWKDVVEIATEI